MKRLALILLLLISHWLRADCASDGISFFPTSAKIATNSIFVIGTYGNSQKIIPGLGKRYKIYLQSGEEKINLITTAVFYGKRRVTQALLKPETPLTSGKTYQLVIENIMKSELPRRRNAANEFESFSYTVSDKPDLEKPVITSNIKEIKKQYQMYGCGNAVNVIFNCPIKESNEFLVKATVKNLVTGEISTYCIEPENNQIAIGHDMCSGAFSFGQNAEKHQVEFEILDASGNLTQAGMPVAFTNPTFENNFNQHK